MDKFINPNAITKMMKIDTRQSLEDITCDLIRIPSETGKEKQIADAIFETMKALDYTDIRTHNNLIYNMNIGADKTIALICHIDTVKEKFEGHTTPKIENGILEGLGSVDDKPGAAAILKLAHEIRHGTFTPRYNLQLVFYAGEEGPLPNGMTHLINQEVFKETDFAFVFEPTELKYAVGCLGRIYGNIHIKGKAAHSASPWEGENAEEKSIDVMMRIRKESRKHHHLTKYKGLEYRDSFSLTTRPSANLSDNVVPELAIVGVEYRYAPFKDIATAEKEFRTKIGLLPGTNDELKIKERMPACFIDISKSPYVLPGIESTILQGWSDIGQLNASTKNGESKVQAINFGPGNIKYAHKIDEHVEIAELHEFYNILKKHL